MADKIYILVVADSPPTRSVATQALETLGAVEVFYAANGRDALKQLDKTPCQLMITDSHLPQMDGLTLVGQVRSRKDWAHISIIMTSPEVTGSLLAEALRAGVDDVLAKPMSPNVLKNRVNRLLTKAFTRGTFEEAWLSNLPKENLSQSEIDVFLDVEIPTPPKPQLRVLVAEDSIASRRALINLLKHFGPFELAQVNNGQDALKELEAGDFNLLLTDRDMPKMGGVELIRKLRAQERFAHLPIILITSYSAKKNIIEALHAGANDYVLKPYDSDGMLHRIRYLITGSVARNIPEEALQELPDPMSQGNIDALLYPGKKMIGPPPSPLMPFTLPPEEAAILGAAERDALAHGALSDEQNLVMDALQKETHMSPQSASLSKAIRAYDFKHPHRVSKDQQRTLENLHSNLARMTASSFSTIQRSIVDCDIAFVDQTTYAEFVMSLANPSCSYTFHIEPLGGPAVINFSNPISYAFINRAFGGDSGSKGSEVRPLTRIERGVVNKVVIQLLKDLEKTWEALLKIEISECELETNPEFMQIARPSDTVILIAFEINMQHASGLVELCLPYFTLEPIMSYLNVQTWASRQPGGRNSHRRQHPLFNYSNSLRTIPVEVAAVCARGQISAQKIADFQVGDILVLNTKVEDPAVVYVENQPLFLAQTGKTERDQYAVQFLQTIPPERLHYYR
ncbi:MAG: flagellar motor switch protein FliM [Candidatus Latescibacterota bacterium]|jgi:flagellar motor switch protein FliM